MKGLASGRVQPGRVFAAMRLPQTLRPPETPGKQLLGNFLAATGKTPSNAAQSALIGY